MLRQWILAKPNSAPIPPHHLKPSPAPLHSMVAPTVPSGVMEEKEQLPLMSSTVDVSDGGGVGEGIEEGLLLSLSRDVHYLSDDVPQQQRKGALLRMARTLRAPLSDISASSTSSSLPIHPATLPSVVSLLLKPLLKRLTDPIERCRSLSALLLLHLLSASSFTSLLSCVPFLLPTLLYRLHSRDLSGACHPYSGSNSLHHFPLLPSSTAESSEEVRLSLLHLTRLLVSSASANPSDPAIPLFLPDLLSLLAQGLSDRCPPIKELSLSLLMALTRSHPTALRPSSLVLCRVVTPLLLHSHHRLRRLSLECLSALIPLGGAEHIRHLAAFQERNVIDLHGFYHGEARVNFMGRAVQDEKGEVRQALYHTVGQWMEDMREAADYETLLMPYLLTGLHDRWESNRLLCMDHLTRLGRSYEEERAEELQDLLTYGGAAEALSRPLLHSSPFFPLSEFPFKSRPSLGLRLRLRPFIDRLLPPLITESRDWQQAVQREALLLLRTMLFIGEEWVGEQWMREVLDMGLRMGSKAGECWGEVMALVGMYGGEEVMKGLRRARDEGRGEEVLEALPALLSQMPHPLMAERREELERWMEEDRETLGEPLSPMAMSRRVRVLEQLRAPESEGDPLHCL